MIETSHYQSWRGPRPKGHQRPRCLLSVFSAGGFMAMMQRLWDDIDPHPAPVPDKSLAAFLAEDEVMRRGIPFCFVNHGPSSGFDLRRTQDALYYQLGGQPKE